MDKKKLQENNFITSQLIDAKIYLGSTQSILDPAISPYLLGIKNKFCIFNLNYTKYCFIRALKIIFKVHKKKGKIFFVGFPEIVKKKLVKLYSQYKHYYMSNKSWVYGVLTNGRILYKYKKRILTKLKLLKKKEKIFFFEKFGGVLKLRKKPDLLVIYNHSKSLDALNEALKMKIPVISFVNSNDNPNGVSYPVPGNFNSVKAGVLYYNLLKIILKNKIF